MLSKFELILKKRNKYCNFYIKWRFLIEYVLMYLKIVICNDLIF